MRAIAGRRARGGSNAHLSSRARLAGNGRLGSHGPVSEADYTQTVEFSSLMTKLMVLRHYRISRAHGAPPIIARWMVDQQCQRHISGTLNGTRFDPATM